MKIVVRLTEMEIEAVLYAIGDHVLDDVVLSQAEMAAERRAEKKLRAALESAAMWRKAAPEVVEALAKGGTK